jgi:hypothetical protein
MTTEALFIVTIVELQSVEILAEALIEICQWRQAIIDDSAPYEQAHLHI